MKITLRLKKVELMGINGKSDITEEKTSRLKDIHIAEYYSTVKNDKLLIHTTT